MKICATVAEYNPFHNGHLYHLTQMKKSADTLVVIMSGNFTQRGEIALTDKYTRAIHAIKAGADVVIELPTVFATANAENFAKGAMKIFNAINADVLSFGCESPETDFISLAKSVKEETPSFKHELKKQLKLGYRFVKARNEALINSGVDCEALSSPNNILALEYVGALLSAKKDFSLLPVKRVGASFLDGDLKEKFSSAKAIRENLSDKDKIAKNIPPYVLADLPEREKAADELILYSLLNATEKELSSIPDCTEGLENRLKKYAKVSFDYATLLKNVQTKRYSKTRIQRILICSLLKITNELLKNSLNSNLYIKALAVKKDRSDILSYLSALSTPLLTRKGDERKLERVAKACFELDERASEIYSLISKKRLNPFEMKFV